MAQGESRCAQRSVSVKREIPAGETLSGDETRSGLRPDNLNLFGFAKPRYLSAGRFKTWIQLAS